MGIAIGILVIALIAIIYLIFRDSKQDYPEEFKERFKIIKKPKKEKFEAPNNTVYPFDLFDVIKEGDSCWMTRTYTLKSNPDFKYTWDYCPQLSSTSSKYVYRHKGVIVTKERFLELLNKQATEWKREEDS